MINLENLVVGSELILKRFAPVDTGNLRDAAIKVRKISESEYHIFIDSAIAPYTVYTNEKWVSPRWNGKENPNYHWIDHAVESIVAYISKECGGELNQNDEEIERREKNLNYWESAEGRAYAAKLGLSI